MKKILVSLVAIAAAVFATSCVNELEEGIKGKAGQVTFTVDAPELATRAFGEGAFAKHLMYAVYDVTAGGTVVENGVSLLTVGNETEINAEGKATVQLELLDGNSYSLLFWAVSADYAEAFTINWADKTMQMKETIEANNEAYDAFYAYVEPFTVDGVVTKSVTLYRPFAQLNYGSNDFNEAKNLFFEPEESQVVIKNVPNVLNCVNGEVSGTTTITYESANVPTDSFTVAGNNYLAMNYVLVGEKKLFDTTLKVTAKNGKVIENDYATVPLQRNYRTNVYGSLLTNSSDFGIELKPGFTDPAHPYNPDAIVVVAPDGTTTSVDSFAKALSEAYSGDIIQLPAGEYTLPANISIKDGTRAAAKAITICGVGKDVVLKGAVGGNDNPGNYATELDITFENLTYKTANSGYSGGFGHAAKVTFNNCDIIGQMYCHSSAPHFFNNCTIDPLNGYLYTCASDVEFKGCTFNASEGKALQVYEDASTGENNVLIENCTFKAAKVAMTASTPAQPVTAIDINNNGAKFNVVVNNCTAEGFGTGKTSGSMLWNIKGGHKNITLTIDGEVVWAAGTEFIVDGLTKVDGVYNISNGNGFAYAAETLKFAGSYILTADIDMAGIEYTAPVNAAIDFDGKDYTISNVEVENKTQATLFGDPYKFNIRNLTIKDSTFVGKNIDGEDSAAAFVGFIELHSYDSSLENCHVEGCTIGSAKYVGGLVGYKHGSGHTLNIKDCSVKNSTIISEYTEDGGVKYKGHCGGVIGYFASPVAITNTEVSGNTFTVKGARCGQVIGTANVDIAVSGTVCGNTGIALCGEINKVTDWSNIKQVVTNAAGLKAAVNTAGATTVYMKAGVYDTKDFSFNGKTLTLIGMEEGVKIYNSQNNAVASGSFDGCKMTFENLTIETLGGLYKGFARMEGVYRDCNFVNNYFTQYGKHEFVGCKFNAPTTPKNEHCLWTYGANELSFTDCEFTYNDRCVNVYVDNGKGGVAVDFINCKFNTANAASVGAIEINASAFPQGAELNFTNCTAPANGHMVFISKWDSTVGATATVTVDGAEINTPVQQ